jgi:hydroxymethylpyrimidine pyrophosphatase-like HAD family hydrolase
LLGTPSGDSETPFVPHEIGKHAPAALHNLQNDLDTLARLLPDAMSVSALDAYLLAAGMNQIAEDHLHPEIYPFDRAAEYLTGQTGTLGRFAGRAAAALAGATRFIAKRRRVTRRVLRRQRELGQLIETLAGEVAGGSPRATPHSSMLASCNAIAGSVGELPPRLRRKVIRLPACFQSFDQQPADVARLARDFASRWPDRDRPLLVTGVRTSGSYLAPLFAAFLRTDGYERVNVLTIRPGRRLLEHERRLARSVAREGGLALLTDDPPVTGKGLVTSARELERAGFSPGSIVLLVQVFGAGLPALLDRYPAVILPWDGWAVSARLTPAVVERELSALIEPRSSVLEVEPMSHAETPRRRHCRAVFRVCVRERPSGPDHEKRVAVEGVGLGYFGAHALAGAHALDGFSPKVFGLRDGLLYREWLADERKVGLLDAGEEQSVAEAVAAYASERCRALPVEDDVSLRLTGQDPAWEVASTIVSRVFGRAWPVAKVLATDRLVKRLLHVDRPSVVDRGTDLSHWFFRDSSSRTLVKVEPLEGSFWNVGLSCFDAAFDLAGATARAHQPSFSRRVQRAFTELGNPAVAPERWLLYELAHLWGRERKHPEAEAELGRARSRVLQRYFAEVYFGDVERSRSGPPCALDVDGVLETDHLGFPALTPASALTLRSLMLHGYRPLLVSGRSIDEIVERCAVYGLAGGVAEYGAASYVAEGERVAEFLGDEATALLASVRSELVKADGVQLDEDYRYAVRAFRVEGGTRRGLRPDTIDACLAHLGPERLRPILGEGQTDFMVTGIDKGTGLRALARDLDLGEADGGGKPFALAVGDTTSDIPLAALAKLACAPAHARHTLGDAGFEIMRAPYQAGLAEAGARLLGHAPGGCSVCRPPPATPERKELLTALAAQERGWRSMATAALRMATRIG